MAKHYVVWQGKVPGIYTTWADCEEQVKGYKGAKYKGFPSKEEAIAAYRGDVAETPKATKPKNPNPSKSVPSNHSYIVNSICTDAACSGNPGELEFRGVYTSDSSEIFHFGPFPVGTNNLGEFLAIVHGLKYLQQTGETHKPIYADSQTGIAWVRDKRANTNLERNSETRELWSMIDEAISWLHNHTYQNPILKWDTKAWGEIKADFGRK